MSVSVSASALASPSVEPPKPVLLGNQAPIAVISPTSDSSQTGIVLGGVAVGLACLGLLFQAYKSASAPDADGKKPSFSEIRARMFGAAKNKALDIEADLKEKVVNLAKDPMNVIKDPNAALKELTDTVKQTLAENLPATDSSVVLDIANEVLSNQIPGVANVQINQEQLQVVQQMLTNMSKPTADADADASKQA